MSFHKYFWRFLKADNTTDLIEIPTGQNLPRAPRVRISALHQVVYHLDEKADGAPGTAVVNLSISGLGLLQSAEPTWPAPGTLLKGKIQISQVSFPLTLKLVHITRGVVGCAFHEASGPLAKAIESYFSSELEALEMISVPPERLAPQPDGTPHWLHGKNNSELYYVERDDAVLRFFLLFFGSYLEGGRDQPTRFGILLNSESVRWFEALNSEQLTLTLRFLANIRDLPPAHRDGILKLIC